MMTPQVEVMELTAASAAAQQQHQHMLLDLQAQRLASSMDVPTLPDQVRVALRELNCPVRLFGENLANVRDRLRLELAKRQVYGDHYGSSTDAALAPETSSSSAAAAEKEETKYTRAIPALIAARERIATASLEHSRQRLDKERQLRASYKALYKKRKAVTENENVDPNSSLAEELDKSCCRLYQSLQKTALAGSQYGDDRPLSAMGTLRDKVFTASWSATLQWWDGSSPTLDLLGKKRQAHEDRIMGVDVFESNNNNTILAATASIDLTAKIWKIREADSVMEDANERDDNKPKKEDEEETPLTHVFEEVAHLQGHAARLCKVAFHPLGDWVATTSHDHTWRLWDIETQQQSTSTENQQEILLQDGHADKVFGIDFHPDAGSLCATTDYSGMIHLWDLRTGKTVIQYYGHAGRVLQAKFAPTNGFQLTSAGDDGCLKVWDLRHRRRVKGAPEPRRTIPAHSRLVTQLEYLPDSDECVVTSSFDGTAKIWSTRGDWKLLQTLEGHEGKVTGVGVVVQSYDDAVKMNDQDHHNRHGVVTCGFDKTLKLWRYR
ncbi:U4 u6 small nuclear ribonucleoprotein [Seminavis robusta]|uniref:U4 u6 small nuclear ribonucleoprotein n=1 Tax=Seminavis robusta TaxID=568900 RepID=A0A9N8DAU2_9STRA|nr:U4 u6 small nuclear ribonucleoprotein [Seminavis robusta]|eukprot:Sro14_g010590.1 U4 u6 small nuclear ribonucleoprotein (551) ;mRNA; r:89014-90666